MGIFNWFGKSEAQLLQKLRQDCLRQVEEFTQQEVAKIETCPTLVGLKTRLAQLGTVGQVTYSLDSGYAYNLEIEQGDLPTQEKFLETIGEPLLTQIRDYPRTIQIYVFVHQQEYIRIVSFRSSEIRTKCDNLFITENSLAQLRVTLREVVRETLAEIKAEEKAQSEAEEEASRIQQNQRVHQKFLEYSERCDQLIGKETLTEGEREELDGFAYGLLGSRFSSISEKAKTRLEALERLSQIEPRSEFRPFPGDEETDNV